MNLDRDKRASHTGRDFLLSLCATGGGDPLDALAERLDELDREWILARAIDLRVFPLLRHWVLQFVPEWVEDCREFDREDDKPRRWAMRSMAKRRAAIELAKLFDEAGVQYVLLKGGALALSAYPNPALRPMRDLDLLVAREDAMRGYELVQEAGYLLLEGIAPHGLDDKHHLPVLVGPDGVLLELHHRLIERGWYGEAGLCRRLLTQARTVEEGGYRLRIADPVSNALHLFAHAGLAHLFSNGPQVLADIHYLDRTGEIDWIECGKLADELGLERTMAMVMAIYRRSGGTTRQTVLDIPVPEELVEQACDLMVQRPEELWQRELMRRHAGGSRKAKGLGGAVRRALAPRATSLARFAGGSHDDPRRWLAYPGWLVSRGRSFLSATLDRDARAEASRDAALSQWLAD